MTELLGRAEIDVAFERVALGDDPFAAEAEIAAVDEQLAV
jgi:hypothetical protein